MKLFRMVAAAAASMMIVGSAAAADPVPMMPAVAPVAVAPAPAFDWSGMYFGVMIPEVRTISAAGLVGFNMVRGNFLAGVEMRVGGFLGDAVITSVTGRAGFILGDRVVLYGLGGVGLATDFSNFQAFYTVGTGLEFAPGSRVSIFAETRAVGGFGGGFECCMLQVGVRIHR